MSAIRTHYEADPHVAEIYDRHETQVDDIELIRTLIAGRGPWRVLEPFCGTGRIFIPLALDGHEIVGLDRSEVMLDRARAKIAALPPESQRRIALSQCDVLATQWPAEFDLVLLGGNCFYEFSSPEEQEDCIERAEASLRPGGFVYVDNDHMEGELDPSWRVPGERKTRFPEGVCADGARVEGTTETVGFDAPKRLWRARRTITVSFPDGRVTRLEYVHQKHPVSFDEVRGWLEAHGFAVERTFGDRAGNPYTPASDCAIFWARKETK
jgi:SAM-dependent methyltransferase